VTLSETEFPVANLQLNRNRARHGREHRPDLRRLSALPPEEPHHRSRDYGPNDDYNRAVRLHNRELNRISMLASVQISFAEQFRQ
jgi:hypothetical protein